MRRIGKTWLLVLASFFSCVSLCAAVFELDAEPVHMGYEIVGTVPEEGYLIKGEGWTQLSYLTKDETGRAVKVDRLADLKTALEVASIDGKILRVYYRTFMVFPEDYWPKQGSAREVFPSRLEIEAPLDKLENLDEFRTGGHAERIAADLAGASLAKLQTLGYPHDEEFITAFRTKIAELLKGLHAELPNQLRWMYERYLSQVEQETAAAEEKEARLKAEALAARAEAEETE